MYHGKPRAEAATGIVRRQQSGRRSVRSLKDEPLFAGPLIDPVIDGAIPELRILRLLHPVTFVGEIQLLRLHFLPLQGGEQLVPLADVETIIELPVDDQGWSLHLRRVEVWRPLAIELAIRPGRALELPFVEPQFL